jgi:hypothetical protein
MDNFDKLYESLSMLCNTTKMFYPRNLKFSDKFIESFKEEYLTQKKMVSEAKGNKAFGAHFERMLKGLRFEAKKIEDENKPTVKEATSGRNITQIRQEIAGVEQDMDQVIKKGGRVGYNDPLSRELFRLRAELKRAKKKTVKEGAIARGYPNPKTNKPVITQSSNAKLRELANQLRGVARKYVTSGKRDFPGEKDMETMFRNDAANFMSIAGDIEAGRRAHAAKTARYMDTAARDYIPQNVYDWIFNQEQDF